MSDLLFDVPWWIPTFLLIIGGALFINGNKRQVDRVRNWGGALMALAIAWALLSYFVDTDKEKVQKQTQAMVQDVVAGDWPKFQAALTPTATFSTQSGALETGADRITRYAKTYADVIHLKGALVRHLEVEQTDTLITARFGILSQQDAMFASVESSTWQFDWERTSQGWRARDLKVTGIGNVPSSELEQALTHHAK